MAGGAIALMIATACVNMSGPQKEACEKGIEAGAKQTGIEQVVNKTQKKIEKGAEKGAKELLGQTTFDVAGGTVFLAKTAIDKSVKFKLPTLGLCDRLTNTIGVDKYSVLMEWGF